jgi:two-component system invasion response regulator UvrY
MIVLVADDHAVLRQGLKQILVEGIPQVEFLEAGSAKETLEILGRQHPDLLVLDIFLPDRNGMQLLKEIRREYPCLPVLVLSSAPEEQMAIPMLKAGARGYLNKQAAPEDLVHAIRKIHEGGTYLSARMVERFLAKIPHGKQPAHEELSPREFEVMQLLIAGQSIKQIAAQMSLSVKTVSTFHTRLLDKLHLQNDVELVHYALACGLIGTPDNQ